MKPRKASDVASSLERKGFRPHSSHHTFYVLYVSGKKSSVRTRISHGATECDSYILAQMAKQLCLSNAELSSLLDCPLSHDTFVNVLRRKGRIATAEQQ